MILPEYKRKNKEPLQLPDNMKQIINYQHNNN